MRITVIGYKPDGFSTRMGHAQETYCSPVELKHFEDIPAAALFVAELEHQNKNLGDDEPAWSITVLAEGVPVSERELYIQAHYDVALTRGREIVQERVAQETAQKEHEAEVAKEAAREAARKKEMEDFFAAGKKLGYTVQPK